MCEKPELTPVLYQFIAPATDAGASIFPSFLPQKERESFAHCKVCVRFLARAIQTSLWLMMPTFLKPFC